MIHSFDTEIAQKYGLLESVLLNHIYFWIEKNRANESNFYDGTYWTYNSTRAFNELFPYVSERQIKNALKHLREEAILLTGNYNKSTYDRTLWYALSKKGLSIVQKCPMEESDLDNGLGENVPPIPDIIPDNKTDKETDNKDICSEQSAHAKEPANPLETEIKIEEPKSVITLQLVTGEEHPIILDDVIIWQEAYPAVDVMQELRKMKAWLLNNPRKRKTKRGVKRFANSWLAKEQDRGGVLRGQSGNTQRAGAVHQDRIAELAREGSSPVDSHDALEVRY